MVQKYTIWKLIIQNSNKENNPSKGFTLLELIFGMLIMIIISGLALNAFIEASNSFNKDKVNIDSAQKLSTVLELIGNEVRQSGEQINDARFPVIEIEPNTDAGSMVGSSKITIRKSLSVALTLCGNVAPTPTTLIVTDDTRSENNCKVGTPSTTTLPTTISRPNVLRQARDKRCQVDDPNGNYNVANTDFCQGNSSEVVMAAMSDGLGNIRTFKYTGDTEVSATTYQISINNISASRPNAAATYASGTTPIYLIEESVYSLVSDGSLQVAKDGEPPQTLVKGITEFNVSARVYGDKENKTPDIINAATTPVAPNLLPIARRCDAAIPYYICSFNPRGTPIVDDWKTLQGVRIALRGKYDATGRSATPSAEDLAKLSATAEYFPRNVLSR